MNRLYSWDKTVVSSDLIYKLNSKNVHDIAKLDNFVLKSTINTSIYEPKDIIFGLVALELVADQKAKVSRTKKSVAAFKTRKFMPISAKVTIRNKRLYCYLDFFNFVVLPKWPQFKELTKSSLVNGKNSISLGLTHLSIFPQLTKESELLPKDMGLTVTINVKSVNRESDLLLLLSEFQLPVTL